MRIRRLVVRDFRGLRGQQVDLAPTGVTVLEAPNEAGKSSLMEALDLLLRFPDSSKAREVRDTQPVGRDVATEIEADIETGPYQLHYAKRFHKQPQTRLQIAAPRIETLTGRDAHDRMTSILEETLDGALWEALRFRQGVALGRPQLGQSHSLAEALDRAAGGSAEEASESGLYEAVREQYLRYFTPTGAERKELGEADARAHGAAEATSALEAKLEALCVDLEMSDALDRQSLQLETQVEQLERKLAEYVGAGREVERRRSELDRLQAEQRAAEGRLGVAERDREARQGSVQTVDRYRSEVARLTDALIREEPALAEIRAELTAVRQAVTAAADERTQARLLEELRQADLDQLRDTAELAALATRRLRVEQADAAGQDAERFLASCRIDADRLETIRAAHLEVEKAAARLAGGGPAVHLQALADVTPLIGGRPEPLPAGQTRSYPVADRWELELANELRVVVQAGTSVEALKQGLDAAQAELAACCEQAGVRNLDEARAEQERRLQCERQRDERDRIVGEALGDWTRRQLTERIDGLQRLLDERTASRPVEPPLPADLDEARGQLQRAHALAAAGRTKVERLEAERQALQSRLDELNEGVRNDQVHLGLARQELARAQRSLEEARTQRSDEQIAAELEARRRDLAGIARDRDRAQQLLADVRPDELELLTRNAESALARARDERKSCHERRIAVRERLRSGGEEGLAEQLDHARAVELHSRAERDRLRARAAAAKRLFEVMTAARDEARDRYRQPLAHAIDELGRIVFGPDFAVELDENLQIARRILGGEALEWACLSTGAQEQLAILTALASAKLVAADGVPVVLDDALGYTDPVRLEKMGAIVNLVGRTCQIVVLTCVGDRYRAVGDARVVRLA